MNLRRSWQKRFSGRIGRGRRILREARDAYAATAGARAGIVDLLGRTGRFFAWNRFVGAKLLDGLGLKPDVERELAAEAGAEWRETAEAVEFCGLRVPAPANDADRLILRIEAYEIVLPWFLRRRFPAEAMDPLYDALCAAGAVGREGPYELDGDVALEPGDVVFDCGANFGVFSAVAAASGCAAHAFEPIPYNLSRYLRPAAALHPGVVVCPKAVWNRSDETLSFTVESKDVSSARADAVRPGDGGAMRELRGERLEVSTVALDDYVERAGLARVDFIKADVEGAEREMLRGAAGVLRRFAPKLSLCTYHLPDDPEVMRDLILSANPGYVVRQRGKKLYAHVPRT